MKCLLLAPSRYPFIHAIESGVQANDITLKTVDYLDFFNKRTNQFISRLVSLPRKVKDYWQKPYSKKVNENYLQIFNEFQPDLVFIYNDQLISPETLAHFKKTARITFMLGDNPLYTPSGNLLNLHILFYADYIISPDTMWCEQLSRLGIKKVVFDCFGPNTKDYFPFEPTAEDRKKYASDLVFVGSASKTNWGYKRALFLNIFKDFNLKAYFSGSGMERWLEIFPDLRKSIISHDRFDPAFNNMIYNCSKIAPIEQVPSLFNGIHVRVFDALGAGILPLCEYSRDMEMLFDGIEVPFIKNYREGKEIARYWLENEEKREECVRLMRERVEQHYMPEMVIERMMNAVFSVV